MIKRNLWSDKENQELADKYFDNELFKTLNSGRLKYVKFTQDFALSQSELFYNVIYSLDVIRGIKEKSERIEYCRNLWNELFEYFTNRINSDDGDWRKAASLVTMAVYYCVNCCCDYHYTDDKVALFNSCRLENPENFEQVLSYFQDFQNSQKNQKVRQWLKEYFEGDSFLSDEISQTLDCLRQEAEQDKRQQELLANAKIDCYYASGSVHNDNRKIMNIEIGKQKQINNTENEQQYLQ